MKMFTRAQLAAVASIVSLLATNAHAALPEGVSTSITAASTDGVTLVGLMAAAGAAVYLIAKLLKKFGISF